MSFLQEIISRKRERLEATKRSVSLETLSERAYEVRSSAVPHRLLRALEPEGVNIIAEFKRKSPSKGVIREGARVESVVEQYESGGAVAISVLTEEDYFAGSLQDLNSAKATIRLPVLRKDFLFDEYQVFESAAAGADAVLLIVAALDDDSLLSLRQLAEDQLGMDALVEVHDEVELSRAVASGAGLIGVNNRNLHTFEVSLATSFGLASRTPPGCTLVSESGLNNAGDLVQLRQVGFRGFLIGESLMRAQKQALALRALIGSAVTKHKSI